MPVNLPRSVDDSFHCVEACILQFLAISSRDTVLLQDLDEERSELFLHPLLLVELDVVDPLLHGGTHYDWAGYYADDDFHFRTFRTENWINLSLRW